MKLYLVHGAIKKTNSFETVSRWCGSKDECALARRDFVSGGAKRADLTTTEVDVPTNKAGLIEFLNKQSEAV